MARMDARERDRLPAGSFAYVDSDGGEHLPVHDASHVRNAIARFDQTEFESRTARERARRRIVAAAGRFDIEIDPDSDVMKPNQSRATRTRAGARGTRKTSS